MLTYCFTYLALSCCYARVRLTSFTATKHDNQSQVQFFPDLQLSKQVSLCYLKQIGGGETSHTNHSITLQAEIRGSHEPVTTSVPNLKT